MSKFYTIDRIFQKCGNKCQKKCQKNVKTIILRMEVNGVQVQIEVKSSLLNENETCIKISSTVAYWTLSSKNCTPILYPK